MVEIVKKVKSKDQVKKEHKLAVKEAKKRQKNDEIEEKKREMKIFLEWRTQKCRYCESIFNIEYREDIITESYPPKYYHYVKCPNCGKKNSLGDIPYGIIFFSKLLRNRFHLLFGYPNGILSCLFNSNIKF